MYQCRDTRNSTLSDNSKEQLLTALEFDMRYVDYRCTFIRGSPLKATYYYWLVNHSWNSCNDTELSLGIRQKIFRCNLPIICIFLKLITVTKIHRPP